MSNLHQLGNVKKHVACNEFLFYKITTTCVAFDFRSGNLREGLADGDQRPYRSVSPYMARHNVLTVSRGGLQARLPPTAANELSDYEGAGSDEVQVTWMDLDKLGNLFSHHGSSLYLRLGALCKYWCICHWISQRRIRSELLFKLSVCGRCVIEIGKNWRLKQRQEPRCICKTALHSMP